MSLDTDWRPLENNMRLFVSAWRPRKLSFRPFFLVWEALSIPHTLWIILKSSALIHTKPIRLPSNNMLILCLMRTNWQQLDTLFNPVALKVIVWSRGRLVTLQILTSSSFSLVEETRSSLGQCVSFSLIHVGSGLTACVIFSSFLFFSFYPTSWKFSDTVLIDKNKGAETDISSYWPIGLANTLYKL